MKVIITGSEGFIGRALSLALQKRGIEVIGIDRKNGQEAADIAKYMPDDLDAVFHLAAQTSVFNTDLIQIRKDNIDTFMAVVKACAKHPNKPKLVYASSSTANPPNTTSLYGITKRFAEVYARIYLPSATGARLHNVYGPNPRQGSLLWCLINQDLVTQQTTANHKVFTLAKGDKILVTGSHGKATFVVVRSQIKLSWSNVGSPLAIDSFSPGAVLDSILTKLGSGAYNAFGSIQMNERIARSRILPAECIRGLEKAKLYSSFDDFCKWMELAFGYTYRLGTIFPSPLTSGRVIEVGGIYSMGDYPQTSANPPADWTPADVVFNEYNGRFTLVKGGYWYTWPGSEDYSNSDSGLPHNDRLYNINGRMYYFGGENRAMKRFNGKPQDMGRNFCEVIFCPRTDLFLDAEPVPIEDAKDIQLSVDKQALYSTIEIGYPKKEYDSVNGRDEFNFTITYSTGCSITDRTLTFTSPYRADSYGIEFTAQKRGEDTSDGTSDKDVFVAFCSTNESHQYVPARSIKIDGALSDRVFNAEFAPNICLDINAGYLGRQSKNLNLTFASATGNSDISINGKPINEDIALKKQWLTCEVMEFSTAQQSVPTLDSPVMITSDGMRYVGFITEAEEHYTRPQAAKYKLLIKSMELCS